jgi:hypothetical protein
MSERKAPISIDGYQKMIERTSIRAKLGFQVHAHMLRHACGYKLANDGTDTRTIEIEALAKLRRGGEQTVRVEHVHVYPGGQAVVGNVTTQPGGGGGRENGGQAHATNDPRALAFAPGSPVWSADAERKALPVPCGKRQEAVPNARRRKR